MQINRATLALLPVLQGFGLNRYVRGWDRALTALFPREGQASLELKTKRWGITYLADPINYLDWDVLCHGDYEAEDLELFRRFGKAGAVCLDIGANVGHHAIFFGALGWVVHAFEPNPQLWSTFDAKVATSGLSSVTLHRVGLGAEDATLEFELENPVNSGTGRFTPGAVPAPGSVIVGHLPVRNGDTYTEAAGIDHVDVVKIDAQGFEPEVLTGLRRTLVRDRPLVGLEIGTDNISKFGSLDGLRSYLPDAYSFFWLRRRNNGLLRTRVPEDFAGAFDELLGNNVFCVPL